MAGFYREFLNMLKQGMKDRRDESWFHSKIETRSGMQTSYIQMDYNLIRFLEWLEMKATEEDSDITPGSMIFMIGGE